MRLFLLISFVLLAYFTTGCLSFEDGDEDTIIINALPEGFEGPRYSARNKRQFSYLPSPLPDQYAVKGSPCDSLTEKRGTCTTISGCYPLIYSTEGEETRDPGLIDAFKAASGVCNAPNLQYVLFGALYRTARSGKELICCTSGQQNARPIIPSNPDPSQPEKFVVGGTPAEISRFPWVVSMHIRGRHSCGGSLIGRSTVLTAAHCVQSLRPQDVSSMKIYFGHHDISQGSALRGLLESRTATQIKYHRGFSMSTLQDDIALIILNSPAPDGNPKIKPVTLANVDSSDKTVTVAGWGQTSWTSPTSSRLLEATMDVWTPAKCQLKYSGFQVPVRISAEKQVCAGSPGRDSCRGDSGGPLHVIRGGSIQQVGVVSFGGKCGEFPGVYTRPTAYSAWIQKNRKD